MDHRRRSIGHCKRSDEEMPEMEALIQQGIRHLRRGEYGEAIALYEQGATATPDDPRLYVYWGLAWLLMGQVEQAQALWFAALTAIDPDQFTAAWRQGLMTEADTLLPTNASLAAAIYTQLLEFEEQPAILYRLGWALALMGRLEEAIAHWQQILDCQPEFVAAQVAQGEVYQRLGQWQEAIAVYSRVLEAGRDPKVCYNLGLCLTQQGQWQAAIDCFKHLLEPQQNWDTPPVHGELAYLYLQQAALNNAWEHLIAAVQAAPNFVESYCRWASDRSLHPWAMAGCSTHPAPIGGSLPQCGAMASPTGGMASRNRGVAARAGMGTRPR
ncbi:MAG: tetratricopeptide repeat protein [Leptolyngbyaceae cyanobacterium SL_7_1]|nr:tetratricopeptide repeat protein [Leptolyngbyaceae cyanobacterium SL_7_1]